MEIIRFNDAEFGKKSAFLNQRLTQKAAYLEGKISSPVASFKPINLAAFSWQSATTAVFTDYSQSPYHQDEKSALIEEYLNLRFNTSQPAKKKHPRKFFCSYFISQQILSANLENAVSRILARQRPEKQERILRLMEARRPQESDTHQQKQEKLSKLVKTLVRVLGDAFIQELEQTENVPKFSSNKRIIYPRYTSPQMLHLLIRENHLGSLKGVLEGAGSRTNTALSVLQAQGT